MADKAEPPAPWREFVSSRPKWPRALLGFEWCCEHAAAWLDRWAFLAVLEYIGKLSLVGAAIVWLWDIPERKEAAEETRKTRHYAAWQTINSAAGKPGDGGRSVALADLLKDGVSLEGIILNNTTLPDGTDLHGAKLMRAEMRFFKAHSANLRNGRLMHADLYGAKLTSGDFDDARFGDAVLKTADFSGTNLHKAEFTETACEDTVFDDTNLSDSSFLSANVEGASFKGAWLCKAKLTSLRGWRKANWNGANIHGVLYPPDDFVAWAKTNGAVDIPMSSFEQWKNHKLGVGLQKK
jgi:hypothetical protein